MRSLILQASARPKGDTYQVAQHLARKLNADHLVQCNINFVAFSAASFGG